MAWWIAESGSPMDLLEHLEVSEATAKSRAVALSEQSPGTTFQVRYHANANAPTEVRWEALDGLIRDPSDRRVGVRHFACFPAHLERPDGGKSVAMMHDLSVSGALLVVRAALEVGDEVSLELYVTGDPDSRTRATQARVVRVEALEPAERALWSHRVAVHFDHPLTGFEAEITALEAWQKQLQQRA